MSIGMYYIKDSSAEAVVDALKKKRIFSDLCFEGIDLNTLDSMEDEEISLGLSGLPKYSSLIWGEGEMHHTSLAMSPKAKFIKSVDDGHSDYFDFSSRDLNPLYATHNSVLMNLNPNVIEIESLGSGYIMFSDSVYKKNKAISFFRQKFPGRLSAGYESFRVHKSIDFDVLHGFPARTYYQDCDG
ncbi:MAG: hypothetical protein NDI94_05365, partial [Candidatus Woesearchaeota archaeon]|nr:hypothetical protein [Candidatus Woesearchaeota archaeon]